MRFLLNKYVFDVLSVMLGVLLAFGLAEWNETRNKERLAEDSFERIVYEVKRNREILRESLAYYKSINDDLKKTRQSKSGNITFRELSSFNGFNPPTLTTASYDVAIMSQAMSFISIERVEMLTSLYEYQDFVVRDINEFSLAYLFDRDKPTEMLAMVLVELKVVSASLIGRYDSFLESIGDNAVEVDE